MSLGPENAEDILARVLAQVMRRDVTTECWQLYAGGGIAVITVYKKEKPDGQTEFRCVAYLEGRLVMSCDFLGDLIYYRVTPTFHHWLSDNARNGFTFQNSKDADVFAAAVKKCVEHLLNVFLVDYDWSETLKKRWLQKMLQLKGLLEPPANLLLAQRFFNNVDSFVKLAEKLDDDEELGDDDVFMSVDLPREQRSEARTQAQTSGARRALAQMEQARQHRLRNANGDAMLAASSGSRPSTSRAASAAYRLAASASRVARKAFKKFPGTAARVPSTTRNAPSTSRKSEAAVRGMELLGAVGGSLEDDSSKEESSSSYHYPIIHQPQSETSPSHFRHCFPSHTISSPVVNQPARSKKPEDSKYPHLSRSRQEVDGKIYAHSDPGGKNFDRIQSIPSSFSDSTLIPMPHRRPADFQGEMEEEKRKTQTVHGFPQLFLDGKPTNAKIGTCRYCSECYDPTSNPKGSCVKAPDRIKRTIETVTCVGCAGCIQYHCSNEDDNGEHHPCSCRPHEDTGGWLRLAGLGCLSVAAPCIWCYWPLSFCYSLCVKCHCAGGQHSE